jgi:hypothetical protein
METLVFILVIILGNALLPLFLPWWIFIPFNILASFPFRLRPGQAFWLGGMCSGLVWLGWSWWLSLENKHILAGRLWQVLGLPHQSLLFFAEFLIPFLLGGTACMAAIQFKQFKQSNG